MKKIQTKHLDLGGRKVVKTRNPISCSIRVRKHLITKLKNANNSKRKEKLMVNVMLTIQSCDGV